jgi:glycosyltransferase involved in cell wall biosynthesis
MSRHFLRIAYVWDRLLPTDKTDTEQAMATLTALARRGHNVVIVVPRRLTRPCPESEALRNFYQVSGDFTVEQLMTPFAPVLPIRKLIHALRVVYASVLEGVDVVYTRNAAVMTNAVLHHHRVVYDTHRAWPDQLPVLRPVFRKVMSRPGFLGGVLHSEFARQSYLRLEIDETRLRVVRNGFDPKRFGSPQSQTQARAVLGLPLDRSIVTYTGHIGSGKGLPAVLELARLRPEVLFLLVGSRGRSSFERSAERFSNVRIIPWQPYDRVALYQYAADVLLLPPSAVHLKRAAHTILPIKVYSYLASGRPILAAATPDVQEVLTHDFNAVLVPPDDGPAAADALATLLADEKRAARLSTTALDTARALSWDARAERLEAFIEERLDVVGRQMARSRRRTQVQERFQPQGGNITG